MKPSMKECRPDAEHRHDADDVVLPVRILLADERRHEAVEQVHAEEPSEQPGRRLRIHRKGFGNDMQEGCRDQNAGGEAHEIGGVAVSPVGEAADGVDAEGGDEGCQGAGGERGPECIFHFSFFPSRQL
jgi:hypothetical protein